MNRENVQTNITPDFESSTQQTNYSLCFTGFSAAYYLVIQPYFWRNLLLNNGLPVNSIPTPAFNLMYTHVLPSGESLINYMDSCRLKLPVLFQTASKFNRNRCWQNRNNRYCLYQTQPLVTILSKLHEIFILKTVSLISTLMLFFHLPMILGSKYFLKNTTYKSPY